jgi:hypothetical protein
VVAARRAALQEAEEWLREAEDEDARTLYDAAAAALAAAEAARDKEVVEAGEPNGRAPH